MRIERYFAPADRYVYDLTFCRAADGWAQIDTRQDAPYYGNWCNPARREITSYCEGDVTRITAETDEEFAAELRRMAEWNDQAGHGPMKIDPGFDPALAEAFRTIGVGDLLH